MHTYIQYVSTHTNLYTYENMPSGPYFAGVAGFHRGHTASPGGYREPLPVSLGRS